MTRRDVPRRLIALLGLVVAVAACATEQPSVPLPPPPAGVVPWGGIGWIEPEVPELDGSTHLAAVEHGPTGYVAVGFTDTGPDRDGLIMHSADGAAWEDVSGFATEGLDIVDVAANGDAYVAIAQATIDPTRTVLLTSLDGRHWVRVPPPDGSVDTYGHDVAASPDGFLAAGGDPAVAASWRSADGTTWEAVPGDGPTSVEHGLNSMAATDAGWAALGQNVAVPQILQSADGLAWFSALISSDDDVRAYELTIGDTGWYVAGGQGSCGPLSSCPEEPVGWWSVDTVSWHRVPSDLARIAPGTGALTPVGDAGFLWVDGRMALAGPDPLRWTEIDGLADDTLGVASGIAVDDRVVVVGERWQPDGTSIAAVAVGDRIVGD